MYKKYVFPDNKYCPGIHIHCARTGRTCEVLVKAAWAPTCRTDLPRQSSKAMVGTEPSQPTASSNDDITVVDLGEHLFGTPADRVEFSGPSV